MCISRHLIAHQIISRKLFWLLSQKDSFSVGEKLFQFELFNVSVRLCEPDVDTKRSVLYLVLLYARVFCNDDIETHWNEKLLL